MTSSICIFPSLLIFILKFAFMVDTCVQNDAFKELFGHMRSILIVRWYGLVSDLDFGDRGRLNIMSVTQGTSLFLKLQLSETYHLY